MSAPVCQLVVRGAAETKGSKRAFVVGKRAILVEDNQRVRPWMALVRDQALQWCADQGLADGTIAWPDDPIRLEVRVVLPRPKSAPKRRPVYPTHRKDGDKLLRAVWDALTGVLYRDDGQIVEWPGGKRYALPDEQPRTIITVEALT